MVPKVAGKGASFKGAALYYLHDKGARSKERVAFTQTLNLPTPDADKAFKCMAWTALHQNEIKMRAGGSMKGRKLREPVYTYSLSWAPDERPTQDEMLEAAKDTLKTLGLDGHETILVAHRDEPHPHIHVIVNRVHPETGIAAKLGNDHLKLSRWAEAYEKQQGIIRCEQRVENNERRRQGEFVKDRRNYRSGDFYRWRRARLSEAFERRRREERGLTEAQRKRRDELHKDFTARREQTFRERTRNNWRVHYLGEERQRQQLAYELEAPHERLKRLLTRDKRRVLRFDREVRTGFLSRVHKAAVHREQKWDALLKKQRKSRTALGKNLKNANFESVNQVDEQYRRDLVALKELERQERDALSREHSRESQEQARRIKEGRDYTQYRKDKQKARLGRIKELKEELTRPRGPGGVSDQFRKAARAEKRSRKFSAFRDTADDISKGRGRERSIRRKPPGDSGKKK